MYGLVNKAIQDLVVEKFGQPLWKKIKSRAKLQENEFVALQTYDDKITYDLVASAAEELSANPSDLLREFGKYWILFTAKEGYGEIMNLFGTDFRTCLKNLNTMHSRMGATMPELRPPRFVVKDGGEVLELEYYSKRAGLEPMVCGLLEGLAEKFQIKIEVTLVDNGAMPKIFAIKMVS